MFTISQRKQGKSTIYIKNNEEGRSIVNQITSEFPDASVRIRPLLNGKIAVDVYDEKGAAQLIDALLIAHQKAVDERKRARWDAEHATYHPGLRVIIQLSTIMELYGPMTIPPRLQRGVQNAAKSNLLTSFTRIKQGGQEDDLIARTAYVSV